MVRLTDLPPDDAEHLATVPCPRFETTPWVEPAPLASRTVALINSAGLITRDQRPFLGRDPRYRTIPNDIPDGDVLMSHVSVNYDRTGFQQDLNMVLPRQRLGEMVAAGEVGGLHPSSYSFMGATDPTQMAPHAARLAKELLGAGVGAALLMPV